jgi:acyl-CoA reductase-like NAD-dependent aldehyde dehydrogenase
MASIRDLKKDINYVLGDIIEGVYVWEYENTDKGTEKSEAIIDEAISTFDALIARVNERDVEDRKAHLKSVSNALEDKAKELADRINKL